MSFLSTVPRALLRRQDHGHELPFELRIGFDLRHIGELRGDPIHHLTSELRVCDLSAPEHQRHLYLVSVLQELPRVTGLRHEVVLFDSRPVLHFLQVNDVLLLFGLARHLRLLEFEFPVVHDAGHGWPRHWCNLHEIQSLLDRGRQSSFDIHDSELRSIGSYDSDGTDADLFIDAYALGGVLDTSPFTLGKQKRGPLYRSPRDYKPCKRVYRPELLQHSSKNEGQRVGGSARISRLSHCEDIR